MEAGSSSAPRSQSARRPLGAAQRRPARERPTADGALVKIDSSNAVQILLLIGGITLIPAILFTVTGFTRILIVLGFIRTRDRDPESPRRTRCSSGSRCS